MDRTALSAIVDDVKVGATLQLTFKPGQGPRQMIDHNMKVTLTYLCGMNDRIIHIGDMNMFTIVAVIQSMSWDGDHNRTVKVTVLDGFDRDWFEKRLRDGLESVKVL